MSSKKKRKKVYKGSVQATQPSVVKVSAVKRSRRELWWQEKKPFVKPLLIILAVITGLAIVIIGLIDILTP